MPLLVQSSEAGTRGRGELQADVRSRQMRRGMEEAEWEIFIVVHVEG